MRNSKYSRNFHLFINIRKFDQKSNQLNFYLIYKSNKKCHSSVHYILLANIKLYIIKINFVRHTEFKMVFVDVSGHDEKHMDAVPNR